MSVFKSSGSLGSAPPHVWNCWEKSFRSKFLISVLSQFFPFQERLIVGSCSCKSGYSGMLANIHPSPDLREEHTPAGLCKEEGGEVEEYPGEQVEDRIEQGQSRRRVISNHFWQKTATRDKLSRTRDKLSRTNRDKLSRTRTGYGLFILIEILSENNCRWWSEEKSCQWYKYCYWC